MGATLTNLARTVLLLAVIFAGVLGPATSASAQTDQCDDLIDLFGVDDPGGLIETIEQAEAETGVDFHVFAIDELAAGQDLAAASFANCSGSFVVPGDARNDTVVIAVAVADRDFTVTFGENLEDRLDDDVDAIFDRMAAWFQNGDFGMGLAAGVDEAADGLATEPSNTGGLIVGGVGVAAAVAAGGVAVGAVRRKNKREREEAAASYNSAAKEVTAVQARWYDAEEKATFLSGRLTGASLDRLETAQVDALEASRRLYDAWSPVSELDGDKVADFDDASQAEAFNHVASAAAITRENNEELVKFETLLEEFEGSVDEMATLHTHGTERITAGRAAAATRSAEGWDVSTGNQRLDQLDAALGHVDAFALRIDVDSMRPTLEPLVSEANSIATDLEELDERRDATDLRRTTTAAEADGQLNRVATAGAMIDTWKLQHAFDAFDDVLDHPAEAAKQLERAQQHLASAASVGEIPRNLGVLRGIGADLDAADVSIDLADELLDEIDALDVDLASALRDAPGAVAQAQSIVQTLSSYVTANSVDLARPAQAFVSEVARDLSEAEAALASQPPNSLLAIELAEDVEEDVDEQLTKFKARVDERQRFRDAAITQARVAQNSIDRADRHVDSHAFSGRQSANAQRDVDRLRQEFNQVVAQLESNPEQVRSEVDRIAQKADQIYQEAQRQQRRSSAGPIILGGGLGGGRGGGILGGGGYGSPGRSRSRSTSRSTSRTRSRSRSRSSSRRSGGGFKRGRSGKF